MGERAEYGPELSTPIAIECDVMESVRLAQSILADLSISTKVQWKIDDGKFRKGVHISHPEAISFVLLSTLQKAVVVWHSVEVKVYFKVDEVNMMAMMMNASESVTGMLMIDLIARDAFFPKHVESSESGFDVGPAEAHSVYDARVQVSEPRFSSD